MTFTRTMMNFPLKYGLADALKPSKTFTLRRFHPVNNSNKNTFMSHFQEILILWSPVFWDFFFFLNWILYYQFLSPEYIFLFWSCTTQCYPTVFFFVTPNISFVSITHPAPIQTLSRPFIFVKQIVTRRSLPFSFFLKRRGFPITL